MNRKVNVMEDLDGKKTVFIHDVIFKGKKTIDWNEVEKYLKRYVGEFYKIEDSNDIMFSELRCWSDMIKTERNICMI